MAGFLSNMVGDYLFEERISTERTRLGTLAERLAPSLRDRDSEALDEMMQAACREMGGRLILDVGPEGVFLVSEDVGPGIPDIAMAMREGYSTASEEARSLGFGAGMGLPNMKRNADEFDIQSEVGKGTRISMRFRLA